jgi:hypothetical protein
VGRSIRASGSGQCPTIDCREDGRGITVSAASTVEHRAFGSSVERRAFQRRALGVRVEHRDRASVRLSTVKRALTVERGAFESSIERSGRTWGFRVEHRPRASVLVSTVETREDGRGNGSMMPSSRGYGVGGTDCRASSVRVERRTSSIPTSSVGRSSRASGSGSG